MNATLTVDRVLDLRTLLDDLVVDGRLSQTDANLLSGQARTPEQSAMHPLSYVASQRFHDQKHEGRCLDDLTLTDWLAHKADLNVIHIDPLKIKSDQTTEVMSFAFAKRHGILCIDVSSEEIVVACMQPFVNSWIPQLEPSSAPGICQSVGRATIHPRVLFIIAFDFRRHRVIRHEQHGQF